MTIERVIISYMTFGFCIIMAYAFSYYCKTQLGVSESYICELRCDLPSINSFESVVAAIAVFSGYFPHKTLYAI